MASNSNSIAVTGHRNKEEECGTVTCWSGVTFVEGIFEPWTVALLQKHPLRGSAISCLSATEVLLTDYGDFPNRGQVE